MTLTASEHWHWFAEFCRLEMIAGGPDPHMKVVVWLSQEIPFEEQIWRAGCYVNSYNVPSAEAIWTVWPWKRARRDPAGLSSWILQHNRKGITTRPERRCVISGLKFSQFMESYLAWLGRKPFASLPPDQHEAYEQLWESSNIVQYNGRYSRFKLLEILRRFGVPAELPDLRPAGGWSPRLTLALLMPEHREVLTGNDRPATLEEVNRLAAVAKDRLATDHKLSLSWYDFEVLLCDYRQLGRRQFPGHSQDSELKYHKKIAPYWKGQHSRLLEARAALFPHEALGELQGWAERLEERKELSYTLERNGYLWSDLLFCYNATADLAHPVPR